MDPMALLHLSSVLDPNQNGGVDFGATMPSYDQQNALEALLGNYPTQQAPSFMQKLAAGLVGAGTGFKSGAGAGMDAATKMLMTPYDQQINDWQNQTKVQQQLAADENQSNTMKRQLLGQQLTNVQKNNALEEKSKHDEATAATAQQNAVTAAKRADAYQMIAAGAKPEFTDDGKMIMVDRTGAVTPVDASIFSPEDMQKLKDQAAMARTNATQTGADQRNAATIAGENQRNAATIAGAAARQQNVNRPVFTGPDGKQFYFENGQMIPVQVKDDTGQLHANMGGYQKTGTQSSGGSTKVTSTTKPAKPGLLGSLLEGITGTPAATTTNTTVTTPNGSAQSTTPQQAGDVPKVADVPMGKRVVGQTKALLPNGKVGVWNGAGWMVQ